MSRSARGRLTKPVLMVRSLRSLTTAQRTCGWQSEPMDVDELIARESIRDLVARYNSTADSARFEETMALFATDAVMDVEGERHDGRDAIRAMFEGAKDSLAEHTGGRPKYLRHFTSTLQIDVTGPATAKGRCYYHVLLPEGLDHWGRYIDEYGLVDGRWVFTFRREVMDGYVVGGFAASTVDGHHV